MTRHVTYKELSNTSSESSQKILPDMLRFVFVYDTRFGDALVKDRIFKVDIFLKSLGPYNFSPGPYIFR